MISNYVFLSFTIMHLIILNLLLFKPYFKNLIYLGIIVVVFEFLILFNILDLTYGDDMLEYSQWFHNIKNLDSIFDLDFEEKDPGFSILLYIISFYANTTNGFFFFISIFSLFLSIVATFFINREFHNYNFLRILFFVFTILLLNRYYLAGPSNVLRSFIVSMLLLIFLHLYSQKRYIIFLIISSLMFFVHQFQTLLFLLVIFVSNFFSYKNLKYLISIGFFLAFTGILTAFLKNLLDVFVTEFISFKISALIKEDYYFTSNMLFQEIVYIYLPLIIILKNLSVKEFEKLKKSTQFIILFLISLCFFEIIFAQVTPRSTRLVPIILPILYIVFIKYSNRYEKLIYFNLIILVNFFAIYRNIGNFVI